MKKFRVKIYEVHRVTYEIEAESLVEAIRDGVAGYGYCTEDEAIGTDLNRGMDSGEVTKEEARQLDSLYEDGIIRGVHSVKEIEE